MYLRRIILSFRNIFLQGHSYMKLNIVLSILMGLIPLYISADSLPSIIENVLDTNPIVKERLYYYEVTKSEIGIAKSGYYPSVDLESSIGRKTTGRVDNNISSETYNVFQNSLKLKQNIFNGFYTNETVKYQKMRTLSASYSYLSKVNDIALKVVNAYIQVQQEKALLENSKLNVKHNDTTYKRVQKAYKAGLSTFSEVSKIHASLSLAKSNLMLQQNKLLVAKHRFRKVVGKEISPEALEKLPSNLILPETQKKAEDYALEYSPTILAGKYNIQGAKALYQQSKSAFYPKVDLELSQNYNENYNEFIGVDDRTQGLVVLSYNLYNGGADEIKRVQSLSKIDQEVSLTNDLKREVVLNVQLAWSSYELALNQLPFLKEYQRESQKTLTLHNNEYQLGKRSLLDLITAENDLKRANDEIIYASYGLIQAKYSIMHAMGLIVIAIMNNETLYYRRVGIDTYTKPSPAKMAQKKDYKTLSLAMEEEADNSKNNLDTQEIEERKLTTTAISKHIDKKQHTEEPSSLSQMIKSLSTIHWKSR